MQTILGSGGAIGVELAKALNSYTNSIRLVSRNPKKVNDNDMLFAANILERDAVFEAVKGSEVVYLTVGLEYNTQKWQQQWPPLMQNVLAACMEYNAKLVFFDNIYMIGGDNVRHITENSPFSSVSKKGDVRAALDKMILDLIAQEKINAIIARSADFYGLINNSVLMEMVYKNLLQNKKAQWICNAQVKHSFTYTPDAGKATAILGNTPDAYNQIWNLPTHAKATLTGQEWIQLFARCMGKSEKYQVLPAWGIWILGWFVPVMKEFYEMRYQYDRDYVFDSSKFEQYFNFTPTTPEQAVAEILNQAAQNKP